MSNQKAQRVHLRRKSPRRA